MKIYPEEDGLYSYVRVRITGVGSCQVCGQDFKHGQAVWYAPVDNNIVCYQCSRVHADRQVRIYADPEDRDTE